MTLGKREKLLAIAVGVLVAAAAAYAYPITSFLDARAKVIADTKTVKEQLAVATKLDTAGKQAMEDWKQLVARGVKGTQAEVESQSLHYLSEWARTADVKLTSVRTDPVPAQVGDFQQIKVSLAGSGTGNAIDKLLWTLETSDFPLQVSELHLNSRKDGTDDLSMTMTVSAIAYAPQPVKIIRRAPAKGDTK
jgi:hypothetical protein